MIDFIKKGKDTSDATATTNDLIYPKTAYVDDEKITGGIVPTYVNSNLGEVSLANIDFSFDDLDISKFVAISHDNSNIYVYKLNDNFGIIQTKVIPINWNTSTNKKIISVKMFKGISVNGYVIYVYIINTTAPYATISRLTIQEDFSDPVNISTYEDTHHDYNSNGDIIYNANSILPHPTDEYQVVYLSLKVFASSVWSRYCIRKVDFSNNTPLATNSENFMAAYVSENTQQCKIYCNRQNLVN